MIGPVCLAVPPLLSLVHFSDICRAFSQAATHGTKKEEER